MFKKIEESALILKYNVTDTQLKEKLKKIGLPYVTLKNFLYEFLKLFYKIENLTPDFTISTYTIPVLKDILKEKGIDYKSEKYFLCFSLLYLQNNINNLIGNNIKNIIDNNSNNNNNNKELEDIQPINSIILNNNNIDRKDKNILSIENIIDDNGFDGKDKGTKKRNLESDEETNKKRIKIDGIIKKSHSSELIEKTLLTEFNYIYIEVLEQLKHSSNIKSGSVSGASFDDGVSDTDRFNNGNSFNYFGSDIIKEFNRFFVIKYLEEDMDSNELLAPPLINQFWEQYARCHIQSYNRLLQLLGCNNEVGGNSPNSIYSTPPLILSLDEPKRYAKTLELYSKHFNEHINPNIWVWSNLK